MEKLKREIEEFQRNTKKVDNYEYELKVKNLIKSLEDYIKRKESKGNDKD